MLWALLYAWSPEQVEKILSKQLIFLKIQSGAKHVVDAHLEPMLYDRLQHFLLYRIRDLHAECILFFKRAALVDNNFVCPAMRDSACLRLELSSTTHRWGSRRANTC